MPALGLKCRTCARSNPRIIRKLLPRSAILLELIVQLLGWRLADFLSEGCIWFAPNQLDQDHFHAIASSSVPPETQKAG
jgi:hypothetical protein